MTIIGQKTACLSSDLKNSINLWGGILGFGTAVWAVVNFGIVFSKLRGNKDIKRVRKGALMAKNKIAELKKEADDLRKQAQMEKIEAIAKKQRDEDFRKAAQEHQQAQEELHNLRIQLQQPDEDDE